MKAWSVNDYNAECGYIVFAETRGKARSLAMGEAGLDTSEWTDVEVRRMKTLDGRRTEECVLDWQKDVRIYYEAGWYESPDSCSCSHCERHEYQSLPESKVTETSDGQFLCVACHAIQITTRRHRK